MGQGTLVEVREGSGDPTERFGTGSWTLGKVRDGLLDRRVGPGHVGGPLGRFGTGRGTFWDVWDGSWNPRGGPGRVGWP